MKNAIKNPPKWAVDVYVCGHYSGAYEHSTREEAEKDASNRNRKFGILGCYYIVRPGSG